jgi:hypothetical protein
MGGCCVAATDRSGVTAIEIDRDGCWWWCHPILFRSMAVLSSIRDQLRFGMVHVHGMLGRLGWEDGNQDE